MSGHDTTINALCLASRTLKTAHSSAGSERHPCGRVAPSATPPHTGPSLLHARAIQERPLGDVAFTHQPEVDGNASEHGKKGGGRTVRRSQQGTPCWGAGQGLQAALQTHHREAPCAGSGV
jgi:hypothetical protein